MQSLNQQNWHRICLIVDISKQNMGFIDSLACDDKCDIGVDLFDEGTVSLPGKKKRDCIACSDRSYLAICYKRSKTLCIECNKGNPMPKLFDAQVYFICILLGYHYFYLEYYF